MNPEMAGKPIVNPHMPDPPKPDSMEFWSQLEALNEAAQTDSALQEALRTDPGSVLKEYGVEATVDLGDGLTVKMTDLLKGMSGDNAAAYIDSLAKHGIKTPDQLINPIFECIKWAAKAVKKVVDLPSVIESPVLVTDWIIQAAGSGYDRMKAEMEEIQKKNARERCKTVWGQDWENYCGPDPEPSESGEEDPPEVEGGNDEEGCEIDPGNDPTPSNSGGITTDGSSAVGPPSIHVPNGSNSTPPVIGNGDPSITNSGKDPSVPKPSGGPSNGSGSTPPLGRDPSITDPTKGSSGSVVDPSGGSSSRPEHGRGHVPDLNGDRPGYGHNYVVNPDGKIPDLNGNKPGYGHDVVATPGWGHVPDLNGKRPGNGHNVTGGDDHWDDFSPDGRFENAWNDMNQNPWGSGQNDVGIEDIPGIVDRPDLGQAGFDPAEIKTPPIIDPIKPWEPIKPEFEPKPVFTPNPFPEEPEQDASGKEGVFQKPRPGRKRRWPIFAAAGGAAVIIVGVVLGTQLTKNPNPCEHIWAISETVEATCETDGYVISVCSDCDEEKREDTVAAGHKWEQTEVVEVTCETDGKVVNTCSVCGETKTEETKADGHKWEITEDIEVTCETEGKVEQTCSVCGETKTDEAGALGHKWEETEHSDATCTTGGKTVTTCSVCGKTVTEESEAIGHNWLEEFTVAQSCKQQGYTYYTCTNCDETKTDNWTNFGAHVWVSDAQPATCTAAGSDHRRCSVCGAETGSAIAALSHNYVNNVCTRCGHRKATYTKPENDKPNNGGSNSGGGETFEPVGPINPAPINPLPGGTFVPIN